MQDCRSINNFSLPELKDYLKVRGVTISGYNKAGLKEIALAVEKLNLPADPDHTNDSVVRDIRTKLKRAGLPDKNPLELEGYTSDFTNIPEFGLIDIFNYMIFNQSDYDGKKLKGYKSFEDYRLFYDGHVESLLFNQLSPDSAVCVFKAKVKPTQRDKTYMNKSFYDLWFVLDKEEGVVVTGHCECIGGADGACRHLAAALYELEAFEVKSCTDGDNQWMKRPRHHDVPVPVRHLHVVRAKYHQVTEEKSKPHSDLFDPRASQHRDALTHDEMREFGLKLQEISGNTQALDILLSPEDRSSPLNDAGEAVLSLSILSKAQTFVENNEVSENNLEEKISEFCDTYSISELDVQNVLEKTEGQSSNTLWYSLRKGVLTASNFGEACNYISKNHNPSKSFMNKILGENNLHDSLLPPALRWGRKKESIARILYGRFLRKKHACTCKTIKVGEVGLLLDEKYPVLGCSVDGVTECKCKIKHLKKLVEIKCPYSMKEIHPKNVAIQKKCIFNKLTNEWEVTKECPYYAQIQGQLGLYNLLECDLVIYTKKGIHISKAVFDEDYFSEMVQKLLMFHRQHIVPQIFHNILVAKSDNSMQID